MSKEQENPKSFLEQEIVTVEQRKRYLWNQIFSFWKEVSKLNTCKNYLIGNPVRLQLGTNYDTFMQNYNLMSFKPNDFDSNQEKFKEKLTNQDLFFLEIIYNEINFTVESVNEKESKKSIIMDIKLGKDENDSKVTSNKDWLTKFNSLPKLISELISVLDYSFIEHETKLKDKNFTFQKLISNKNSDILNVISNTNKNLKSLTEEYLIIQNKNDLKTKVRILAELSKLVDTERNKIKQEFGLEIENKIFRELNNLSIRHNNQVKSITRNGETFWKFYDISSKKVYELTKDKYIDKLDRLFQIIVIVANFLNLEINSVI